MPRKVPKQEQRWPLDVQVSRSFIRQLLQTASEFDLNKGGCFDGRSGCVYIWAAPDDKPACWNVEITRGGLEHPRDYVGGLYWDWLRDDRASLYIGATPYALLDKARKDRKELPEETWQAIGDWLKAKTQELIRLAQLQPDTVGARCPLCPFVLPMGHLLNDLLDHIAQQHQVTVQKIVLGDKTVIVTDSEEFALESVEKF